jgi:outer membrane receptor protein involved in Fe transport
MKGFNAASRVGVSTISMAIAAILFSATTTAQTPVAASDEALSEVVVTGTRIVRDGYTAPTPVTVVAVEQLERASPGSIPDALNYLSLRNLGPIRTLVLLDGQRLPPTSYEGTVDTNIIPSALVSRVDVVTGGASAAYGSDAVSGVVNYILNTKFSGIKGSAQTGVSSYSDGKSNRFSLAAGDGFSNDRGHVLFSYDHYDVASIPDNYDRPLGKFLYLRTGAGTATNPFVDNQNVVYGNGSWGTIFQTGGTTNVGNPYRDYYFLPGGAITPFVHGTATGSANIEIGGSGNPTIGRTLTANQKTDQGFGRIDYSLTENLDAFVQMTYAHSFNDFVSGGGGAQLGDFRIAAENAFLPATVSANLIACGAPCAFTVAGRVQADQPFKRAFFYNDAATILAGLKGTLGAYKWRAGYGHGKTSLKVGHEGNFDNSHWYAALDAVRDTAAYRTGLGAALAPGLAAPQGNIVCRVTLTNPTLYPGCVPINIFGKGSPTQAAWDYVSQTSRYRVDQDMDIFNADISGEMFNLPAGAISWAAGAEYRSQKLAQTSNTDPTKSIDFTGLRTSVAGTLPKPFVLQYNSTNQGAAFGDQNVKEAFAEVAVPVLKNSAIGTLDLNGAFRYTNYSTSGNVNTWKVGLSYSPIDQLRFRTTVSRDIRAPTLYELYAGKTASRGQVADPHTGGTFSAFLATSEGNPALTPEIGDTITAGIVWQPTFVSGLSTSIDYYSIKIKDAVGTLSTTDVLSQCELSGGTADICKFVVRPFAFSNTTPANYPISISQIPFNQASVKVRGIDYEFAYRRAVGKGLLGPTNLDVRLLGNYLLTYDTQAQAGGLIVPSDNSAQNVKNRINLQVGYSDGPLGLNTQARYYGSANRTQTPGIFYANNKVKSITYVDATINYKIDVGHGKFETFLTVNNIFDPEPPIIPGGGNPGQQYATNVLVYDVIGTYYTAGVRFKF